MKIALCATLLILLSCKTAPRRPVRTCELRGEVIRLDPQVRTAVIRHEKICDWMGAMTMEFPVRNDRDFTALKPGARITATVFIGDPEFWIANVQSAR